MEVKFFVQGHFMLHSVSKTSILSLDSKALVSKLGFERVSRKILWQTKERQSPENQPSLSHSQPTAQCNQILLEMPKVGYN